MPNKLLATTIIFLLAIAMLASVSMSKANFIPPTTIYISSSIFYQIPASQSEKAISNYKELGVPFYVEVKVPNQPSSFYQEINHIYYRIDEGTSLELTNVTISQSTLFSDKCTQYSANGVFDYPEDGNHTLTVYTQGTKEQITRTGSFLVPRAVISSQPTQSASLPSPTPTSTPTSNPASSPTPTISQTPSIAPSPTSYQSTASDYWLNPTATTAIAVVIVIVAIALVSLLYFKRNRKNNLATPKFSLC